MDGSDYPKPDTLDSAMDKLKRADRLECTADLNHVEARALLFRVNELLARAEELESILDDLAYEKNTRD